MVEFLRVFVCQRSCASDEMQVVQLAFALGLLIASPAIAGPQDIRPYLKRGLELGKQGKWSEAIAELRRAVELQPASAEAHYSLGVALFWTRQLPAARQELERFAPALPWACRRTLLHGPDP